MASLKDSKGSEIFTSGHIIRVNGEYYYILYAYSNTSTRLKKLFSREKEYVQDVKESK